jgi:predicted MPP superfamily phosphohydrolase
VIVLLGDFVAGHRFMTRQIGMAEIAPVLARLKAPLGVFSILGNHDWWDDLTAQRERTGPIVAARALRGVGIPVLENEVVRLTKDGQPFWLAGLGDQIAYLRGRGVFEGVDDLPGTLAKVDDAAPVILLAHEPDIFPDVPKRVALTLSGHTHGGQVRLFGYSPIVPSRYGNRYAYGHVIEEGRHLIVSGGLGTSILPVRLGVAPEILLVELGASVSA